MLAVEATRFGGPDVLVAHEMADPPVGPGQVAVEVAAADLLFVETQVRSGWGQGYFSVQPPYVPGDAVAGRVVETGAGVDPTWQGRRVLAYTDNTGGYAERAVVGTDMLAPVPDAVSFQDAAALAHDGPMALTLLDIAVLTTGQRVLVLGANGGAGLLVVQLAAAAGAEVVGAARGERKGALVRRAGATTVVDPSETGWLDGVGTASVVFDGVGGTLGSAAFGAVADGGQFFAYGAPTGEFATIDEAEAARRGVTVHGLAMFADARRKVTALAERAFAGAAAGRLRPVVGRTYPLREAATAHEATESRAVVGKIVLVR